MWWVYVDHAYTDAEDEDHEIELACSINDDGDLLDVLVVDSAQTSRALTPAEAASIDDQDLRNAVRSKLREGFL